MDCTRRNVFNITSPERYRCQVYRYFSGLSRLYLSVYKDARSAPAFYLLFADTGYFSGPMGWQGADFCLRSADDCLDLLVASGLLNAQVLRDPALSAHFARAVSLYTVDTGYTQVAIAAGSASLLQKIPANLDG